MDKKQNNFPNSLKMITKSKDLDDRISSIGVGKIFLLSVTGRLQFKGSKNIW